MRYWKLGNVIVAVICGCQLVSSGALAAPSFEEGVVAYKRGDYGAALTVFRPLAEKGVPRAQTILGLMYSYGEGVPVDLAEAARWYRLAAEQGYSVGQYNLGMVHLHGRGVKRDRHEAVKWLEAAARGGHFRAKSELALLDPVVHASLPSAPRSDLDAPPDELQGAESQAGDVLHTGDSTDVRAIAGTPAGTATDAGPAAPRSVVLTRREGASPAAAAPASSTDGEARGADQPPAVDRKAPTPGAEPSAPSTITDAPRNGGQAKVYRVQLAASQSESRMRRNWSSLQSKFPDVFADLDGSIERAEVGESNTVWYRLRVGPFNTEARAKELCLQIRERGIRSGCLPLRVKR